ncbi:hypothetical protein [Sulfitobacter sp. JB4-11]|uniref:hypothetical protein n=1 Tax=Sulfitobacter rhodophyticola TaxID=3238304 RepID=UPI003516AB54
MESDIEKPLEDFMTYLDALPPDRKGMMTVEYAAKLVECAAYEVAGEVCATTVSSLILCSAELSRLATRLSKQE